MLRTSRLIHLACVAILLGACATGGPSALHDGPAHVLRAFVSALNRADIDAITQLFAPDATAFLPLDSFPSELVGREAIRSALLPLFRDLRQQASGPEYMHLVAKDVRIQSFGKVAIVTFDAGVGPVTSRRTLVLSNTPAGWQITHFHGSNIRQRASGSGP